MSYFSLASLDYDFVGKDNEKWKMLGNTIPTIFTEIIGKQIIKHTSFNLMCKLPLYLIEPSGLMSLNICVFLDNSI